jgi:transposase InsO family protein
VLFLRRGPPKGPGPPATRTATARRQEPSGADRWGHPDLCSRFLGTQPPSDRRPELDSILTPRDGRPPWRGDLSPILTNRPLPRPHAHPNTSTIEVLRRLAESTQFTSWSFTQNLKHHELLGSMGTIGDCFDNSPMESFWGSMQIELLNRKKWMTYVELATAMADYIVNFYNPLRRHSSLSYLTPDEFEALSSGPNQARTLITVGQ